MKSKNKLILLLRCRKLGNFLEQIKNYQEQTKRGVETPAPDCLTKNVGRCLVG